MKKLTILFAFAALLTACNSGLPKEFRQSEALPSIYPDYTDVTIPINIAPLTFEIDGTPQEMAVRFTAGQQEVICTGEKIQPAADDWQALVQSAAGKAIQVEVYARHNDTWTLYKPFSIYVSKDSIDPYISYRLISPSYVAYDELTISQRCLENYDESVIYDNMLCGEEGKGQCINCHNYQQYNPERMQFHARENLGGTVIAYDGKVKKVNMRNDSILSAGVYPTWHPWLKMIVYSTNKTSQTFHAVDHNKVEVFDTESDLIAYDIEKNEIWNIENEPNELEVFPFWTPDGKTLYYCSAHFEYNDSIDKGQQLLSRPTDVKYNVYKKSFNPETKAFGPRELVFDAVAMEKSATFPRISPDGRFLVITLSDFGVFPIWHHEADLWKIDVKTNEASPMTALNSEDTESYHSWSSNGKWMIFSSRRYDGQYTRPFIAHIDQNGNGTKPFELPCADPDYHRQSIKCYNIPEFMRGPVTINTKAFADVLKGEPEPVKYSPPTR